MSEFVGRAQKFYRGPQEHNFDAIFYPSSSCRGRFEFQQCYVFSISYSDTYGNSGKKSASHRDVTHRCVVLEIDIN